jgi:hypothetical protein
MLPAKKEQKSPPLEQKSKALPAQKEPKMPVWSRETESDVYPSLDHTALPGISQSQIIETVEFPISSGISFH